MSKEDIKDELKRERIEALEADKAWAAKVRELEQKVSKLEFTIEVLLADIANHQEDSNPNEQNTRVYHE